MKKPPSFLVLLLAGLVLGAGAVRLTDTKAALAQSATAAPVASTMPVAPAMPMHGAGMGNCNRMNAMMAGAHGTVDKAYMQSMMQMHRDMSQMQWTGDADRDFMVMMIPHHQAAIAASNVELKYGKNPKVLGLARAILAAQTKEIAEMKALLAKP